MHRRLVSLLTAGLVASAVLAPTAVLANGNSGKPKPPADKPQVCANLDHKVDVTGKHKAIEWEAPEGMLIDRYCVKAGSINQGDGPVYVQLTPAVESVVITHPSGKDISHYSVSYVPVGEVTPLPGDSGGEEGGDNGGGGGGEEDGTPPAPENPVPENPAPEGPEPGEPFDWNWTYPTPRCDALLVTYPANIPAGQANDVNIRIRWAGGETTLNFHNDHGTWSGTNAFVYSQHPQWPAGVTAYEVVWVQVAGTNYHYGESFHNAPIAEPIRCRITSDGDPETVDVPQAVSRVVGWKRATNVRRGAAPADAKVVVVQPGVDRATLQRRVGKGAWRSLSQVAVVDSRATVRFPKVHKAGTYRYRLVVPGTLVTTGTTTGAYTVKVRRR